MARSHFWQHLLNSEGQPISGAKITLDEDVSGTPISFYTTAAGGTKLSSVETNKYGFFEVWVPDKEISLDNGYATNTTFTLNVSSASLGLLEPITGIQLLFQPPRVYTESFPVSAYSRVGNINSIVVTHDLNTDYPLVNVWLDTQNVPVSCTSIDSNSLSVSAYSVSAPTTFYVNVVGKDL
jgi:hypothetical protein